MPELPEVETVVRALDQSISNKVIEHVTLNRPDLRVPFPEGLSELIIGQQVSNVSRRAKYILIGLNSHTLLIHLGMSGKVTIVNSNEDYHFNKHDHFILDFSDGSKVILNDARRFGMVLLYDIQNVYNSKPLRDLGPEPLGNKISGPELYDVLQSKQCSIKSAMLDQKVISGIGNIYACEALYLSGIDPRRRANQLTLSEVYSLLGSIKDVLLKAIDAGGSTLKDYKQPDGDLGYFQFSFSVYDKEGQPCSQCTCNYDKTMGVQRIIQSGRSTFFCEEKQK
jgi:formamidopyrimidine-DNA glycosylase